MFDVSDFIPEALWPANWVWWWSMFLPCIGVAVLLWVMGISGSGWAICFITAVFVFLTSEFCQAIWKVLMRAGFALTAIALITAFAAAATTGLSETGNSTLAQTLDRMHALGFLPFMISGFVMCTLGGIIALFRGDA